MTVDGIKAEIRRIVAYQFDRATALTQEAYNDSLEMIANQIYDLFSTKGEKDEDHKINR